MKFNPKEWINISKTTKLEKGEPEKFPTFNESEGNLVEQMRATESFLKELKSKSGLAPELLELVDRQDRLYTEEKELSKEMNTLNDEKDYKRMNEIDKRLYEINMDSQYVYTNINKLINENPDIKESFTKFITEKKKRDQITHPIDPSLN